MSTTESPSKFYVTWEEFTHKTLELSQKLPKRSWKGLIAITRGGLAPAAIIAQQLNIRNIDTISISSYDDMDQQKKAEIIKTFSQIPENGGEYWLVVDDLVDTGSTLNIVRDILPKAHYATVYAKPKGKSFVDTYISDLSQNTWIVFPWESEWKSLIN
ncbi:MAG: xanthine phosphoribosyltransferase [Alphaproteobacteria bacterium]|nr:xanthine phosphoribosyltransferase [Alphaproteobacteria bacterium]MBT5390600.1 xanthine phosphoribosyltransferase [Alphaproteobacteria bacterium]MBT5540340.1 xanthine phosphoribosyltransferase [Alphaproteobacteria bacterium]MBT5654254.1 xanthine phosphoribosyltransferase [Alphaproteobacteria bacterium]